MVFFACYLCQKILESDHALKKHLDVHKDKKPFQCQICDQTFSQEINMKTHVTLCHTTDKPFPCEKCGKSFARTYDVNVHTKKVHNDREYQMCNLCGKQLLKESLQSHKKTHTKDDRMLNMWESSIRKSKLRCS